MKVSRTELPLNRRLQALRSWLDGPQRRLGLITSIDGGQLVTLVLDPKKGAAEFWETPLKEDRYPSLTPAIPRCHWSERAVFDLFGLYAEGHPRMKNVLLHEWFNGDFFPLRTIDRPCSVASEGPRRFQFLSVHGDGVYEIPVGPIHAGIIEPGHFRLSCLGEVVMNLELRLGFLHRGVEKRLTEVPWQKARFVAEAAATDTTVANAVAHAVAIESLLNLQVPDRAQYLRSLALEVERIATHIIDIGGMATDVGFLGVAANLGRLRGNALRFGDILAGSRFMRGFVCPGGVARDPAERLEEMRANLRKLLFAVKEVIDMFMDHPTVHDRLENVCRLSPSLGREFGLVGVAGRACGIEYDTRHHFSQGVSPRLAPEIAVEKNGDVFSRVKVRVRELYNSFAFVDRLLQEIPDGPIRATLPESLPADEVGVGITEAFRGELIHMIITDDEGKIKRYAIKDPSFGNWTGISIAVRDNLVADFPVCNKSFSLSYSGHDL